MKSNQILAIETSSSICGVAIFKNNELVSIVEELADRKHAEIIPSFIEKVVSDSGISLSKLNAIAISIGPGSFTGLRIGLGFAKGIAYAKRLPIIPVPTMTAMAFGLKNEKPQKGISLSHSNKVFYQEFFLISYALHYESFYTVDANNVQLNLLLDFQQEYG